MRDQISRLENAGSENTGPENAGLKMQDWKMENRNYGVENAGAENAGLKMQGGKCSTGKCGTSFASWIKFLKKQTFAVHRCITFKQLSYAAVVFNVLLSAKTHSSDTDSAKTLNTLQSHKNTRKTYWRTA